MKLNKLIKFVVNIHKYKKNKYIKKYLKIYNINLSDINSNNLRIYTSLYNKFAILILHAPTIIEAIIKCVNAKHSNIDYLEMYSQEQINYITHPVVSDLKLIACAGSGKTRSIIGRIRFLTTHCLVKKENVYMITFSKAASIDFCDKVKSLFPKYEKFCILKNFSTIDSLAKSILCRVKSHKSENVEILSIALRNFLIEATSQDIVLIKKYRDIRHIFVDEAQDLNETQFDILRLLKIKFGTTIEIIGDPNQNIYQFRRSSSSYLLNYSCDQYNLTLNFRSSNHIISFSESLKPITTLLSRSATNKQGSRVTILTKPSNELHKILLCFLNAYNSDLSNIAIICPTRGIGNFDNVGLSLIFNLLKVAKIPFNQLYNETGCYGETGKNFSKKPGCVNIITYHGTKGLEFDVVFVMDFYQHLFNIQPTEDEHNINRYLLYVATSRAINKMFICVYTNVHGGFLNYWIKNVDPSSYTSDQNLKISKLAYRSKTSNKVNAVTELINSLSDYHLDKIDDMFKIVEGENCVSKSIYNDCSDIDRGKDEAFFGILCEELFYLQWSLIKRQKPRPLNLIKIILESRFVLVSNDYDFNLLKIYIISNHLTWEMYDSMIDNIPNHIKKLVEKYFDRNTRLDDCIVCTNEFIKIIDANISLIKESYNKYCSPEEYNYKYKSILEDFYYLIVVQYAYDNNHYYYIANKGKDKSYLLKNGKKIFKNVYKYIKNNYTNTAIHPKKSVYYKKLGIVGEIDFIEENDNGLIVCEIKCTREISIKYYLQLLLYNFCYNNASPRLIYKNKYKLINLLTGIEYSLSLEISKKNMFNLLNMIAKIGSLDFTNLNMIYDLETTGQITTFTSKNIIPSKSNTICYKKGNIYVVETYPEITEIAVKDYDTEMIVISSLVKPKSIISQEITKITGISNKTVCNKPNILEIRNIMESKMSNFIDCKMIAHNGNRFDNKIITYYKLVDQKNISFIDTMSIIPMHMPTGIKLQKKSLSYIYYSLFGKEFNAHRAMNDVNALIKIMKKLKIYL